MDGIEPLELRDLDPNSIYPVHVPKTPQKMYSLRASMEANGWIGRPLLVCEQEDGLFQAITGSHRLFAARLVPLQTVPAEIVQLSSLQDVANKKNLEVWQVIEQLHLTAGDPIRLHRLIEYDLRAAALSLIEEIRSNIIEG